MCVGKIEDTFWCYTIFKSLSLCVCVCVCVHACYIVRTKCPHKDSKTWIFWHCEKHTRGGGVLKIENDLNL